MSATPKSSADVTLGQIFRAFLLIGATSFGGGVVAYLRTSLVGKHRWLDDPTFVNLLAISQTLPGLNVLHLSVLYVLLGVGALAIGWHRPRAGREEAPGP